MDFSKHIQKAEEAARRKNYNFAIELYQQLLEIDPDQGDARAGLRRVLMKRHAGKKGGRFLRVLSGAAPLTMAHTLRKAGRHDACAKSLESYLATSPLDVAANLMLGQELEAAGHYQSARAVYEFVTELDPRNPEGLKSAGEMVRRAGDPATALEYFERALEADPRDQEALKARKNLAAETALQTQGFETAQHSRDQIKDKDEARALERAQRMHLSADELGEELARLEGRFSEDSSNPDLMIEMADVHEKLKDPEAALDMLERAADYRKGSFDLVRRLGGLKAKVLKRKLSRADGGGDAEGAGRIEAELRAFQVENARKLLGLRPGDAGLRLQLGKLLLRSGALDEAMAEFQKAVEDPRQKADALFYLGQAFQKKGFLDLSRKNFERALEGAAAGDERTKEILYNLGEIAEAEGEGELARSCYSRIFEVDIGYRDVAAKMERFK